MTANLFLAFVLAFAGIAVIAAFHWVNTSRYDLVERSRMPAEIADAELVLSEGVTRRAIVLGDQPVPAKFDQVFRRRDGVLVVTESKTRALYRVYDSDIIQLSAQALVLRQQPEARDAEIAPYGYVRVVSGNGPRWLRVRLLNEQEVLGLVVRKQRLDAGEIAPRPAANPGLCQGCGHRERCPHPISKHRREPRRRSS